jgi:hypothetical protein
MPIRRKPAQCPARNAFGPGGGIGPGHLVLLFVFLALAGASTHGQDRVPVALAELPMFNAPEETFSAATAARDYYIRLPEHVAFRDGSELHFVLHSPTGITPPLCSLVIAVNGSTLTQTNLHDVPADATMESDVIALRIAVPGETFVAGWNKVSIQFKLHPVQVAGLPAFRDARWVLRRSECFLSLAFARLPLFPELARFPQSLAEEKLLRPDVDSPFADAIVPALSILVPGRPRDVHLRATAIVAARLGQLGYLDERHCRIQAIEFWKAETDQRNAILIARRDQLGGIELPVPIRTALDSLADGHGLLAEFLHGPAGDSRRLVLISGADDAGLEKAALTVGSSHALAATPTSPAVIETLPEIPKAVEAEARSTRRSFPLSEDGPIEIRGVYGSEVSVSNWRLSPGFQLVPGGSLRLQFTHSPALVPGASSFEVLVNGSSIGTASLEPDNAASGSAVLPLPSGLRGRDPMMLTFRATLALPEADCNQLTNAQAWLDIGANSVIESGAAPVRVENLNQLQEMLLAERFARKAAYAVPAGPSLDQVRALFSLWFELGRRLPSSPALWPEVVTYQPGSPVPAARLRGRSVLLLGPVSHWAQALPPESTGPAMAMTTPDAEVVAIEGLALNVADFDPTLAFTQMMPSPWSDGHTLVLAGGWNDYAIPSMKRLLLDPSSPGQLYGQLGAMDILGRTAAYDRWTMSPDSFAERVLLQIPSGLSSSESHRRVAARDARIAVGHRWNWITFWTSGVLLVVLVLARLLLMRGQSILRQKSLAAEKALGGAP